MNIHVLLVWRRQQRVRQLVTYLVDGLRLTSDLCSSASPIPVCILIG